VAVARGQFKNKGKEMLTVGSGYQRTVEMALAPEWIVITNCKGPENPLINPNLKSSYSLPYTRDNIYMRDAYSTSRPYEIRPSNSFVW
jgi:hypothetical protein